VAQGPTGQHRCRVGSERSREALAGLFEGLVPLRDLQDQALDLALRRGHPVHDCFYVALAAREGAPLLTADRRLAQRFAGDVTVRLLTG
jgi:predicted nucleic acid-binding protein